MSRNEETPLLGKEHHRGYCKGVLLQSLLVLGLTLLAVAGLSELALGESSFGGV